MRLRVVVVVGLLIGAVLSSGCAAAVTGQAEPVVAAVPVTSPRSLPGVPSRPAGGTVGAESWAPAPSPLPSAAPPVTTPPPAVTSSAGTPTGAKATGHVSTAGRLTPSRRATSETLTTATPARTSPSAPSAASAPAAPGIPGLSPACNQVEAAITAFGTVFDGATSADEVISQATADAALKQMPASGLPAQPQADITILRAVVASAGGKTLTELAVSLSDGKATNALEDLATWAAKNCS